MPGDIEGKQVLLGRIHRRIERLHGDLKPRERSLELERAYYTQLQSWVASLPEG
jgi:hypothetical protein